MGKSRNVKIIKNEYGHLRYIEIKLPSSLDNIKEGIRTTEIYKKNNNHHYLYMDKIIKDDDRYQLVITPAIRLEGCLFTNQYHSCILENEFALITFTNTDKYYDIFPNLVKPYKYLVVDLNIKPSKNYIYEGDRLKSDKRRRMTIKQIEKKLGYTIEIVSDTGEEENDIQEK